MSGLNAMSHDSEVSDPLSREISEFREELLLWIDTELIRLRERDHGDDLVMEEEPAAASGSQFGASSSRLGVSRGSPNIPSGMAWQEPRTRERVADRDSVVETAIPPVALPELQTDPEPPPPPSNPRQRLDALARLLDHRLKQGQAAAAADDCADKGRPE
jgi:hypothetical protein